MKCMYHNDMDGHCAASIVAQFLNDKNADNYFEVDYVTPWPIDKVQEGEDVWIVDLSFKKDTVWQLETLLKKNCKVHWIDHHTSSLNLEADPDYAWVKKVKGLRRNGISGAALTYMYITECEFEDIPCYIKLVSDYDCWQYRYDPDTTWFKLGLDTIPNGPLDAVWQGLKYDYHDGHMEHIIEEGKSIKTYIDQTNKFYRDNYAYESEIAGYKCLVVNKKSNSWVFGEKYKEYPVCVVWVYNGETYSYSIYSDDKTVDCSKIAESYGGGGHFSSAGFSSKELLFHKKV